MEDLAWDLHVFLETERDELVPTRGKCQYVSTYRGLWTHMEGRSQAS